MKLFFSLLFLSLILTSSNVPSATAKGGDRRTVADTSGYQYETHVNRGRALLEENYVQKLDKLAEGYMTNSDLEKAIKSVGRRCANLTRIYSIGKSVRGVPLWVIEFSDKPGEEEAEPAFKFIGNVHGDEPVGRELLLNLANWLCDNYMKDPLATQIIHNVHLHILPSMNPDGFSLKRRGNANNVDLNRDFPDQFFPTNDDVEMCQPETKAVMSWLKETRFTASASLHGGALVANYPWDGTEDKKSEYFACPDDETFRFLASVYSLSHFNMSQSQEFKGGITNGASWYPIYGGMQDWNYIHGGCFELTLEISDDKWPSFQELPTLWQYNKMSMLNLVASIVKTGVHGKVFSSDHGRALPASIAIKGVNYTIRARQELADYHRLLAPGRSYEVVATMRGYKTKSTSIVMGEEAMSLDFVLDPEFNSSRNLLRSGYDYSCDCNKKPSLVEFLTIPQLELSVFLIFVLLFLSSLLKRRNILNCWKHRQSTGHRKSIVV